MDDLLKKINKIEEKTGRLAPQQKALLATDGSSTSLLEAFTNTKIKVLGAEKQRIIEAGGDIALELRVNAGEELNKRCVLLSAEDNVLVYAESHTPLSRLSADIREDILGTDMPIGKILKKHRIESRREILDIGVTSSEKIRRELKLNKEDPVLYKKYLIIHNDLPLMKIEEYFWLKL